MIFVAVGTQKFQFNRLLSKIDELIEKGIITEEVFAQIGYSTYTPIHYSYTKFMEKEEFDQKVAESDLLITHSGVGTIISAVARHVPVIVCPRLAQFGEHVDNHQIQIAESFSKLNFIIMCDEIDNLKDKIIEAKGHTFARYKSEKNRVVTVVNEFLNSL